VAAIVVGAAVWLGRSRLGRGPAAALACFAVTLAPALGFVDVYPMRYAFVADHFQYLASLALLTLAAGLGRRFVGRSTVAVPVVAVLATLTCRYTLAYGDVETLWRDTVAKNPRSVLALQNLGTIEFDRGDAAGALALYDRALSVEPDQPDVANSSGIALARLGRLDEARARFEAALRVDPEHAEAARNLGSVLAAAGRREEAIAAYEQALRAKPDFVDAHEDVAVLLEEAGALDRAEAHLRAAVRLDPDSLDAHARLGALLRVAGKPAAAAAVYEQAVRLAPTSYDAWVALADASAEAGDAARAVVATERALAIARAQNRPGAISDLTHRLERLGNQGRS
jgi:tetratricopeptide (TPR) repeat protein